MNRLVFKLLLFFVSVIGFKIFFHQMLVNNGTFYGIDAKWEELKGLEFNTVVCGSSRIYNGINPLVLDSIGKEAGVRAINLAYSQLTFPYTKRKIEELLKLGELANKLIIIELSSPNLNSSNPMPWLSFVIKFHRNQYLAAFPIIWKSIKNDFIELLSVQREIFELKRISKKNTLHTKGFDSREIKQRNHMNSRDVDVNKCTMSFKTNSNEFVEPIFNYELEKFIELARRNNSRILFILPPLIDKHEARIIAPVYRQLEDKNKLTIDYDKHDQLVSDISKRSGVLHFNPEGAQEYSINVGQSIIDHQHRFDWEFQE